MSISLPCSFLGFSRVLFERIITQGTPHNAYSDIAAYFEGTITQLDQLFRITFAAQYRVNNAQTTEAGNVTDSMM